MWPGSGGIKPEFFIPIGSMDMIQKCKHIFSWHENYDIQLYMMYIPEVDQIGHVYGVNSVQVSVINYL
jgi:predicted AlkP superfamily pyrophosphatase or phosphodiesterase